MRKKLQDLTIKDAFMFAAVMSDAEQCRHLLELVLEILMIKIKERKIKEENENRKCKQFT